VNLHGLAYPGSKLDTSERLAQSQKIVEFLNNEKGEKILGGDFNLMPDTEGIRMIEAAGMHNLVKEFNIRTTRSELSYARYPEAERQYFSDYVFVSSGIRVLSFAVPAISVSDHLPMILEVA
jgi:endonuclease/exonuclease/phosphatase family metal-dependent hydrolase